MQLLCAVIYQLLHVGSTKTSTTLNFNVLATMNKTLYTISPSKQSAITKLLLSLIAHQTSLITCYQLMSKWRALINAKKH